MSLECAYFGSRGLWILPYVCGKQLSGGSALKLVVDVNIKSGNTDICVYLRHYP